VNGDNAKRILIVDDEKRIVDIIAYNLRKEGFTALCAHDGNEGLAAALSEKPDLIILDLMMPGMDGFEVCRRVRDAGLQTPIIMLTARGEEADKVAGLEIGADDYVTKPFGNKELIARVRANLRRSSDVYTPTGDTLDFGDLVIDTGKFELRKRGEPVLLTHREFELIKFLAVHKDRAFTREDLLLKVWGYEYFGDVRTVDVTVRRLRSKVEDNPEAPRYILTRRRVGYYFSAAGE
jgi:two-component system response regulator VicR